MKLSIIIPAYNIENYIVYCLNSLYNQNIDQKNFEVIIINDGSTDNTLSIASEYAKTHSNIIIHTQINSGVGAARNRGLDFAKGEYIYFIDPDDYLATGVMKTILNTSSEIDVDILAFNSLSTNKYSLFNSNASKGEIEIFTGIEYIGLKKFKNEIWWYIIRRDFLIKTGIRFIEGRWMEDAIFTASLFIEAEQIGYLDFDAHRHVIVPNSAMTNKEDKHYKKVIYDNANAAVVYGDLINSLKLTSGNAKAIKRMKVRQESFVFFLIARAIKSTLKFDEIIELIKKMKAVEAYPLKNFSTLDYTGLNYKLVSFIFNKKNLLLILFKTYRSIKAFIK